MKFALLTLCTLFSFSALAGTFDINDPRILGQYERIKASSDAEIEDIKIIYNNDNELVLVRDGDTEYPLSEADATGLIHQSEDECNAGSGDEPSCYYDANVEIRLTAAHNKHGQVVPQIKINVDRVDGYDANPDYSYEVIFNWSAEIENAVPFYFNAENPADLKAVLDNCKNEYTAIMGSAYNENRVCHSADSFSIRQGIAPQKAFESLVKSWDRAQAIQKNQLTSIFSASDKYIQKLVKLHKKGDVAALIAAAHPARQYILENSDLVAYSSGSIGWVFVLDAKNGVMHCFAIFVD